MKKLRILIMIIAILAIFYELSSDDENIYITIVAILVFMIGMMRLSAETPSKNQDKDEQDIK